MRFRSLFAAALIVVAIPAATSLSAVNASAASPLTVTTKTLPTATYGASYKMTLAATGGSSPLTWSISKGGLPYSVSLAKTGVLTGTPSLGSIGTWSLTVKATDAAKRTATAALKLTVIPALRITSTTLPNAVYGKRYVYTPETTGAEGFTYFKIVSGALPAGISVNGDSGDIEGTPTATTWQTWTVSLRAVDSFGQVSQPVTFTLQVNPPPPPPVITTTSLTSAVAGLTYHSVLSADGGALPVSWRISTGALPPGLTLTPAGLITGSPSASAVGTWSVTFQVRDSTGRVGSKKFSLKVTPVPAGGALTWGTAQTINPQPVTAGFVLDNTAVSCVSASFCIAADQYGNVSSYDGTSWSAWTNLVPTTPNSWGYQPSVSCASTTFCVAIFDQSAFAFDGTRWSAPTTMSDYVLAVSCPSATFCMAAGGFGDVMSFDGTSWSAPSTIVASVDNYLAPLWGISCVSTTFCVASGGGQTITYNGTGWATPVTVFNQFSSDHFYVACASTVSCVVVSENNVASVFNGTTWSAPITLGSVSIIPTGISCSSNTLCVVSNYDGSVSTFDGSGWRSQTVEAGMGGLARINAVSCPTKNFCMALGNSEAIRGTAP